MSVVAGAVVLVLCALAALHLYWAVGGRWGAEAAVPERSGKPLFRPGPAACVVVAALLLCAAVVVWSKPSGWSRSFMPHGWSTVGTLGVALVFIVRAVGDFRWVGFFKKERTTRFARLDTVLYSPLCLILGIGSLIVALGGG